MEAKVESLEKTVDQLKTEISDLQQQLVKRLSAFCVCLQLKPPSIIKL
jgi:cell division protein FtsB